MPSSLRFVLILLSLAILGAAASGYVQYHESSAAGRTTAEQISGGHSEAGKLAISRYGCGSCHQIPGISGAVGKVGPPLSGIARRAEIAGHLANDPGNMVRWLRDPQGVAPGNAMPNLGVSERDARDIAAYLYTLKN